MNNLNSQYPKVTLITINWNNTEDTIEFLKSVKKLKYPNYEIVVLDNASTCGDVDSIKTQFPEIQLVKNKENKGWGGGCNVAAEHALKSGAQYVWLLNNDVIVELDTLTKLVECAEKEPNVGLVSPMIHYYTMPEKIENCGAAFLWKKHAIRHIEAVENIKKFNEEDIWLWGTAILIKRTVFDAIGYFDNKYFVYNDDLEYSYRAARAGFLNRVATESKVYHKSHFTGTKRTLPAHYFYYMTRNTYFFWMGILPWHEKFIFFLRHLRQTLIGIAESKEKTQKDIVDAYTDGLYSALRNKGGAWDKKLKMPQFIKQILVSHPYLWCDFMDCQFIKIFKACFGKLKIYFYQCRISK